MHPFFYLDIANQHRDELVVVANEHRRWRLLRRRPANVHDLARRPAPPAPARAAGPIDAAA